MMNYKNFFAFFISAILIFNVMDASARSTSKKIRARNPYLITNIFSSAEETTPSDSRIAATKKAHRIAFLILLRNLGMNESLNSKVSDEEIAEAVYSRRITDERIAGNYYSAKFNIAFLKGTVGALLDGEYASEIEPDNIKMNEEIFLFFPVEISKGKMVLWERNNAWRKSVEESLNISNVRNIILPRGDYADIDNVNLKNITNGKFRNFKTIIDRYGADSAIIAYFDFDKIENKANITLDMVKPNSTKRVRLGFVNSKSLSRSGLLLEVADRTVDHVVNNKNKGSKSSKVKTAKLKSLNKIILNVEISDLEEWIRIKTQIENMYFVKKLKLESISRNSAKATITHSSDTSNIAKLFAKYNFLLRKSRNGEYFLSAQ